MPELPEVETTKRGIAPHVEGQIIREVILQRHDIRIPIPSSILETEGRKVLAVTRRAKYLILTHEGDHHVIIHLGMSGSLRLCSPAEALRKHDHVIWSLSSGKQLRFHDPRRFGIVTHAELLDPLTHALLANSGPEPLDETFHASYLKAALQNLQRPIKPALMDNAIVVGVGNIYASESLFQAGIRPTSRAYRISLPRLTRLVSAIQSVLAHSIEQGGTTLRDFLHADGQPGYFRQELFVYERAGEPCRNCGSTIRKLTQAQRSTYFCPTCQKH